MLKLFSDRFGHTHKTVKIIWDNSKCSFIFFILIVARLYMDNYQLLHGNEENICLRNFVTPLRIFETTWLLQNQGSKITI